MKSKSGIIILMYHSVFPQGKDHDYRYSVSADLFEEQIKNLKTFGRFLKPADLLSKNKDGGLRILLTFDDGYKDNYSVAYPILKKYNIPALIFLTTNHIGQGKTFLNWEEIGEMNNSGLIYFGSHCKNHLNLLSLTEEDIIKEIRESKFVLEKELKKKIDFFSYPSGGFNNKIMGYVEESGYKAAFGASMDGSDRDNRVFSLGRIGVGKDNQKLNRFMAVLAASKPVRPSY